MLRSPDSLFSIKLISNGVQLNINDCGAFAIAFAVSKAFSKAHLHYGNSKMRISFLNCIN